MKSGALITNSESKNFTKYYFLLHLQSERFSLKDDIKIVCKSSFSIDFHCILCLAVNHNNNSIKFKPEKQGERNNSRCEWTRKWEALKVLTHFKRMIWFPEHSKAFRLWFSSFHNNLWHSYPLSVFVYVYKCAGISRTFGVGFTAKPMITDENTNLSIAQEGYGKNWMPNE